MAGSACSPARLPNNGLNDITPGPHSAMWFTEQSGLIGRITSAGALSQLALPIPGSGPDGITAGPGRTVWVAETGADAIVRINSGGDRARCPVSRLNLDQLAGAIVKTWPPGAMK